MGEGFVAVAVTRAGVRPFSPSRGCGPGVRHREWCDAGGRRLSSLRQTLLGGGHRVIRVAFQMRVRQWPPDAFFFGPGAGGSPALTDRFIAPNSHRSDRSMIRCSSGGSSII